MLDFCDSKKVGILIVCQVITDLFFPEKKAA